MPRVNIREIDLTGSENTTYVENIALVPGVKIELLDPETGSVMLDDKGNALTLNGTFETLEQFENKVADIFIALEKLPAVVESGESGEEDPNANLRAIENYFIQDKGYATAYLILNGGLPIEYVGLYDLQVTQPNESGESYIVRPIHVNDELYKGYADRGKYDPKFITVPDFDYIEDEATIKKLGEAAIKCAGDRGDAYALLSTVSSLKTSQKVKEWITDNFSTVCSGIITRKAVSWSANDSVEQYGSYGAVFTPNFLTTFTVTSPFKKVDDKQARSYEFKNAAFPAFIDYLLCYAKYTKVTPDWFAISGSVRGTTPLAKFIPLINYGDADVDLLEPRDVLNHISANPIANIRPYGNVIWGNRTMHPLSKPLTGDGDAVQLLASDFLNIRSLCCDLKKVLYRASRRYSFDPNSDTLWFNFKSAITPLLEKMKSFDGIRDYQIIKVPTAKKALVVARIIITPIEAVEDFDLTIELSDSIEVVEN